MTDGIKQIHYYFMEFNLNKLFITTDFKIKNNQIISNNAFNLYSQIHSFQSPSL